MNIVIIEEISPFIGENSLVSDDLEQRIAQHCETMCIKLSSHHCGIKNPAKHLEKPIFRGEPMGIVGKTIYDVIFVITLCTSYTIITLNM